MAIKPQNKKSSQTRRHAGGRPRLSVDWEVAARAAEIGCTMDEIAAVCKVSDHTLRKRMDEDEEFQAMLKAARESGRETLRRLQWHGAKAGNPTMLIWLGKQMLGQRDKQEISGPDGKDIFCSMTALFSATKGVKI